MHLVVCGDEEGKQELLANAPREGLTLEWIEDPALAAAREADAYIDLGFQFTKERISAWERVGQRPVLVNSVVTTLSDLPLHFIRFNGWNGFLGRKIVEASAREESKKVAAEIFSHLNRGVEWIPDIAGFISARVICMIINEAFFALGEQLSTREEIDAAMKLGTNYPYGPFEWSDRIGLKLIYELLAELARTEARYQPAPLLQSEALRA